VSLLLFRLPGPRQFLRGVLPSQNFNSFASPFIVHLIREIPVVLELIVQSIANFTHNRSPLIGPMYHTSWGSLNALGVRGHIRVLTPLHTCGHPVGSPIYY
jgi:hypothetical protein